MNKKVTTVQISHLVTVKACVIKFLWFLWFVGWLLSQPFTIINNEAILKHSNITSQHPYHRTDQKCKLQMVMRCMVCMGAFWTWFYIFARSDANYTNSHPPHLCNYQSSAWNSCLKYSRLVGDMKTVGKTKLRLTVNDSQMWGVNQLHAAPRKSFSTICDWKYVNCFGM